jgi:hypothetical protein
MLHLIAVAPSFLALSKPDADQPTAAAFLSFVRDLHPAAIRDIWFKIFVTPQTIAALHESGSFPIRQTVHSLIKSAGWETRFAPDDLVRMFHSIVERAWGSDRCFGIRDILLDTDFFLQPAAATATTHESLNLCELQFYACCAIAESRLIQIDKVVIPYNSGTSRTIQVSGTILLVEPDNLNLDGVKIDFALATTPLGASFFDSLDPTLIWRHARGDEDLYLAILVSAYQRLRERGADIDWRDISNFRIGSTFLNSLQRNSSFREMEFSSQVLDVCTRIIAGEAAQISRPFRQTANQHSAVRTRPRDRAHAYRSHISGANEGMRLMHWVLANGSVEFANVGPKPELHIEQGNPNAGFQFPD